MSEARLGLFEAWGIELEYMLVDSDTLSVAPIADKLLADVAGEITGDVEFGPIGWSNELVLHVIEFKCSEPMPRLVPLVELFGSSVTEANSRLSRFGACLLPTAMHPWMDPATEMRLWPHESGEVYGTFHRIFDCRGHGWSNLQSMHVNLPFADDERSDGEFARLHAAIRLVLPILPALAASSPFVEGRASGLADNRLEFYRNNARAVPAVSGQVVPETAATRAEYEAQILQPIYRALAPHDPEGVLHHEWANARGAIARFDRSAIEIRVLDVQECPRADLAVAALVSAVCEGLVGERHAALGVQQGFETGELAARFRDCLRHGEHAVIADRAWLGALGVDAARITAGELWAELRAAAWGRGDVRERAFGEALDLIAAQGTLATRLLAAAGAEPDRETLRGVYRRVAECLAANRPFVP